MFSERDCTCSAEIHLHFLPGKYGIQADRIFSLRRALL